MSCIVRLGLGAWDGVWKSHSSRDTFAWQLQLQKHPEHGVMCGTEHGILSHQQLQTEVLFIPSP